jgi:hypothetical protein
MGLYDSYPLIVKLKTLADVTTTTSFAPLHAAGIQCKAVTVTALHGNGALIRVAGDDVATNAANQGNELAAGESISYGVEDVSEVQIKGNGTDKVGVTYLV